MDKFIFSSVTSIGTIFLALRYFMVGFDMFVDMLIFSLKTSTFGLNEISEIIVFIILLIASSILFCVGRKLLEKSVKWIDNRIEEKCQNCKYKKLVKEKEEDKQ